MEVLLLYLEDFTVLYEQLYLLNFWIILLI